MSCELVAPSFLEYKKLLEAFLLKRTRDKGISDDILHDVYLKLYRNCEKLPEVRNVKAWLFEVTRNALTDHFRSAGKYQILEQDIEESWQPELKGDIDRYLFPLIGLLPEMYREPVILNELEGKTQQQIADKLGISLSGAKSRVQRGRQMLKQLFLECCYVETGAGGNIIEISAREGCNTLMEFEKTQKS
jgi:RNA polymerase sigma-70 factor, ECF subfamily